MSSGGGSRGSVSMSGYVTRHMLRSHRCERLAFNHDLPMMPNWPVFRTVQGPHRDGGDDAKKTGRNTTGREHLPSSGPGQRTEGTTGLGGTAEPGTLGLSRDSKTHETVAVYPDGKGDRRTAGIVRGTIGHQKTVG